jgi:hypothetical protein
VSSQSTLLEHPVNQPIENLIKRRIGDSKVGYAAEARVHSFRPQPKKKPLEIVTKKVSQEWMLKGPSRLMLEAFEANE